MVQFQRDVGNHHYTKGLAQWLGSVQSKAHLQYNYQGYYSIPYGEHTGQTLASWNTGHSNWSTRNKMGDTFKKMSTRAPIQCQLIPLVRFSKMRSANQTGLLSLSANPIVGKSAFSSQHKQVFTD